MIYGEQNTCVILCCAGFSGVFAGAAAGCSSARAGSVLLCLSHWSECSSHRHLPARSAGAAARLVQGDLRLGAAGHDGAHQTLPALRQRGESAAVISTSCHHSTHMVMCFQMYFSYAFGKLFNISKHIKYIRSFSSSNVYLLIWYWLVLLLLLVICFCSPCCNVFYSIVLLKHILHSFIRLILKKSQSIISFSLI